jgi:hypothetical protein
MAAPFALLADLLFFASFHNFLLLFVSATIEVTRPLGGLFPVVVIAVGMPLAVRAVKAYRVKVWF